MPHLIVTVAHRLTTNEARRRLQTLLTQLRRRSALQSLKGRWQGNRLAFTLSLPGKPVSGQVVIKPHAVRLKVNLPWYLAPLTASLTDDIENLGGALLHCP